MGCEEFRDRMLDVLYGEADESASRAWEGHQQQCAACRDEMGGLRGLRRDLRSWSDTGPRRGAVIARLAPAWLPVAAALALAVGGAMALAASHQRVERIAREMQAQGERHRAEIDALKAERVAARDAEATLSEVRRLLRESEARQALVLDASLRGFAERTDAQRRDDLAQVSAGFSYLEGRTGLQVARTTELMGHVLQASQQK